MEVSLYNKQVNNRSKLRYYLGLFPRYKRYLLSNYARYIAKKNGAVIGENTVIPLSLARRANKNLVIGSNSSIQTDILDLRAPIIIGNHVIVGFGVEILTCSHNIDSEDWEFKPYGIEIEDYVWIATRAFVLPSCTKIGRGAVCAAGSLIVKNVDAMSVVSGNPAKHLRDRHVVHTKLVVESLLGADYKAYTNTRRDK